MSDGDILLRVKDLKTHLRGRDGQRVVKAVDGVSFDLRRGETLGIIGESGSGKSMTALSIMRILPSSARVIGGEIRFNGENLLTKSDREMRRLRGEQLSMILQDPMVSLDPLFTVGSQLAEPLRAHMGLGGAALKSRMTELMSAVSIPSPEQRLKQYPHQMSGGMLQRIVGAIAISCDPQLLIADEPTTALDPTVQAQFLDLLEALRDSKHLSVIVVTHDFGVAARLCDRVMVMYAGRIVEMGPIREIFDHPRHPYTKALLASIPDATGAGAGARRLRTIEGSPPDLGALPPGCPFAPRCISVMERCRRDYPPEFRIATEHVASCWQVQSQ
ncbi:MAG TPA: ABC transporter ATP-binding protein [Stellaceae bacterium]